MFLLLPIATATAADDTRLLDAIRRQDKPAALALLKQRVDVNVRQADGATALHWAIHWEDQQLTDLLIRAGANVKSANDLGMTPLLMASASGNAAMSSGCCRQARMPAMRSRAARPR
jgi:ankyrin repeat protein